MLGENPSAEGVVDVEDGEPKGAEDDEGEEDDADDEDRCCCARCSSCKTCCACGAEEAYAVVDPDAGAEVVRVRLALDQPVGLREAVLGSGGSKSPVARSPVESDCLLLLLPGLDDKAPRPPPSKDPPSLRCCCC